MAKTKPKSKLLRNAPGQRKLHAALKRAYEAAEPLPPRFFRIVFPDGGELSGGLSPAQEEMRRHILRDKSFNGGAVISWGQPAPEAPKGAMERQVGGSHYKGMKIQHFTFCQENGLRWGESAAIKYICRHQRKGGKEDLLKAIHYLEMVIANDYPEGNPAGPAAKT